MGGVDYYQHNKVSKLFMSSHLSHTRSVFVNSCRPTTVAIYSYDAEFCVVFSVLCLFTASIDPLMVFVFIVQSFHFLFFQSRRFVPLYGILFYKMVCEAPNQLSSYSLENYCADLRMTDYVNLSIQHDDVKMTIKYNRIVRYQFSANDRNRIL